MENLTITKEAAIKAHVEASKNGKILLENLLGKKVFLTKIEERIKSVDDAIKELGDNDIEVQEYKKLISAEIESHLLQYQSAIVICKALNEGWAPDWSNSAEYKYYPWFDMEGSSSGACFSYLDYAYWFTYSLVGSRLCFKSRELAEYAGKQFTEIYKKFMTI
ncbi:hypothetical protein [Chryseobacterium sp. YIM B08800]|uniref:hypothetical protein n=1 Tax=Chryseobacterium sp. YIM B08800 TaxID=2984136 RepID=UPI00223F405B|nr:hypothetical protein [Chryseobacterium sp. YIM B08800]